MTEQQTQLLDEAFNRWWFDEGSRMPPLPGEEQAVDPGVKVLTGAAYKEHIKRIARTAWHNGSYVKFHNIHPPTSP